MATFGAFWALFLQFIVHSSMDCLKRFRRQKPLLVGKLAVVCMQIALWRQNKRVGNYVVIKFMQRKTSWGLGRGIAPSPENFSILSLKMAPFSAFWAPADVVRGHGPSRSPLGSASECSSARRALVRGEKWRVTWTYNPRAARRAVGGHRLHRNIQRPVELIGSGRQNKDHVVHDAIRFEVHHHFSRYTYAHV